MRSWGGSLVLHIFISRILRNLANLCHPSPFAVQILILPPIIIINVVNKYAPDPVLENGHITLYWDRSIITDRTIVANKPDIVVIDRQARRTMIIDITIPHDENLVKAEKDKQIKYLDLAHEVVDMWNVDSAIVVPIVVSANGLIPNSLDNHLRRLGLGGWIKGLMQKAVLLETARIVRRFLSLEP